MSNDIAIKANSSMQNLTEAINDVSQGFTEARREFQSRPIHKTLAQGRILDLGTRYGALAAAGERYVAKYIVGRGYKATDTLPLTKATLIKQHGVVGFGLRLVFSQLGNLCRVAPENNLAVGLADAVMAGVRFVVIGLPEAALVAFGYVVSAAFQLTYDGGRGGVAAAKRGYNRFKQARNKPPVLPAQMPSSDALSDAGTDSDVA